MSQVKLLAPFLAYFAAFPSCCATEESKCSNTSYPLIGIQTGPSSSCDGGELHWWPLDENLCHGWASADSSHVNSASNMACIDEDTFIFTQYAGNLQCQGSGVTKVIKLRECEQDFPPILYSSGIDLACCSDPNGEACKRGRPSTTVSGSMIYADGDFCTENNNSAAGNDGPSNFTSFTNSTGQRLRNCTTSLPSLPSLFGIGDILAIGGLIMLPLLVLILKSIRNRMRSKVASEILEASNAFKTEGSDTDEEEEEDYFHQWNQRLPTTKVDNEQSSLPIV